MGRINIGRLLLAGIVAGIVSDALGYLVDGVLLAQRWSDEMLALGRSEFSPTQIVYFNVLGLIGGLVLMWIYVAIRPRFGGGVMTALMAGLAVWVIGALIPNLSFMWAAGLFSKHLMAYTTAGALGEILIAAVAGAALYKE